MWRNDRGFALLIVAVALAALSLVFAAAISTTRQQLVATEGHLVRVRLSGAIDGAIASAAYNLATAHELEPAVLTGPQIVDVGSDEVTVSARPEAAKLDLNSASPDLLYRYLLASGVPENSAEKITTEILDRRKSADPEYARAHDKERTQQFESVSEIFALKEMTDDIAECIAPDLTVFTRLTGVDAEYASAHVREAEGVQGQKASAPGVHASTAGRAVTAGEIFEVTARAKDDASGQIQSRQVVLRITGNIRTPVWILAESSPAPNPEDTQAACDRLQPHAQTASRTP